jgi:hypothetical protein
MSASSETTRLLQALDPRDPTVAERLFSLVYGELRALAGSYFRRW